ncbi:tex protein-relatedtranscription accessory protein, putative [Perkinsus marinus ATCC 50983]|uniref:Tex protein-relatedtranscription accessory protein, putative n=1 Tax=Perkinsus marinus (strain ATCC 50983 / TXsc) TaxID=423536 RepID=C5KAX6_PERM5|nr:tex protein-relatedtranscription accessory protein, putative [Perkinsus marinus ATCC 50983]EER18302.1 tex protein-relatedtranscription accessory protein, putative [Perkinsus marinus ATCC 50983]|eukprot:XP_002786506.1 tex protein-relatedtranscription accessory protein, putative [Perkinsus marinus ATCC 50983]
MCSRAPQTKRKTKAQAAIDAGFGPAADVILSAAGQASPGGCLMRTDQLRRQAQVAASEEETDVEAAVVAILTYRLAHDQEVRSICRSMLASRARLEVKGIVKRTSTPKGKIKVKPKQPKQQYSSYGGLKRRLDRVKPHEWLAIKRGEAAKELRVKIVFPATTQLYGCLQERYLASGHGTCLCAKMIPTVIRRTVDTIEKSLAREFRSERLTVPAEDFAIKTFTDNVSVKLMCPPIRVEKDATVVGVDPGYVNGHKCVVISATGEVLDMFKFWTRPGGARWGPEITCIVWIAGSSALGPEQLVQKVSQWTCSLVVVGDGQGSAEAVESIRRVLPPHMNVGICVVDECGASIYSAGAVAAAELPDMDISFRGAVSIARRVLDPIAEYVKLEPKNIGVGLFQHDMPPKQLDSALTQAIQWCVCQVGVDLNTASVQLLRYVAGLNAGTAKRIVEYRTSNGRFTCREELKKVKGIGAAVFQQAAGFIRVYDGSEPLDSTGIHPESYDCARQLKRLIETHRGEGSDLNSLLQHVSCEEDSEQARTTSAEVLTELVGSDRDVRLEHPERYRPPEIEYPPYRSGCGITELEVGAHLEGSVKNVVSFGAFVHLDCAESVTGLIHVSNLLPMVTLDSLTVNQHVLRTSSILEMTPKSRLTRKTTSPGSDQELDLLTPLAAEVDDMVVPFTAAESSVDSSADASLPIVGDKEVSGPETTGAVGSSMQIGVSADASLHSASDLWSIDADEGDKDVSSGDESRTGQPPSVTELAEPVTEQSSERRDSSNIPVLGLFESLPWSHPTEGFGSALPPIPELSTGRTSSAGQHDPPHREAAGLLGDPPELAAPSIPLAGSAPVTAHVELPSSETEDGQTVRDWLRRMERVRPQDVFVTNARTGGHRVGQLRASQSIVDQGPTILYRIDIGRVSAPPIPSSLVRGVMVSYRLYVTLFHLKTQVITSRTAVGLKVDAPAGHDFDMSGSFLYHTGSSLPDAQTGVILELALTHPDGERLSAGWTVIPADHALSRGAVLLEGTPRVLPFLKREVIGAFATTQQPTGSLVGLATGGSLEVAFCSLSGEEEEANTMRRMLPAGYVAAAGIPVGCLQTTHITRAGVTIGGITVDIGSHHATAELRDAIRFAARDFSQRFRTPDSNERVELSNRYTVTVYAHNGLQRISPEWAFRMEGDNSGNPVLVSSTYHTIDMVLDDNCALAVELHCHLVEEEPNDVPVCVGWCLLLLPHLDPLTECIASDQTSNSVLLRCHLMSGPGETIAGRKVWIGSPTGIHHSIEFTLTGEAYASWLRARQKALHAELLAAVPISADKTVVLAAETEKIPQPSLVLPPPPEVGVDHFVDHPPSELPAPAMLFESRHVESSPLSPPEPAEQLHRSEVDPLRPSEVDPFRPSEVDPLRPSEVDSFRSSEVEPLRSPETERQGFPDVECGYSQAVEAANAPLTQALIPSIPEEYPAPDNVVALTTTGDRGGLVPEGITRHSLQDAAKIRYDDPIVDLDEPEIVSVKGVAAPGSSPISSVELNPQAGRKPDSPTPRNIPHTNEAPEGIVTASTAEQEVMTAVNWRVEEEDELVNDEISLAIVGWRPLEGSRRPGGKRVYFSAKFYTFPAQNTEVAELPYDTYHSALSSLSTGQR